MIETIISLPRYITIPVVLIGYSMACLGTGVLVFKLLAGKTAWLGGISAMTIFATSFILGQGILASLWLLFALQGWLSIEVVGILCFLFAMSGLYVGLDLFYDLKKQIVSIWRELRKESWVWQLIASLTFVLWLAWVTSLTRPLIGDGSAFYMAMGKSIAFSHRVMPLPGYEEFTSVGLQGELHFAAMMSLHSPDAAKLFSWPTITMAGIMLAALGRVAGMGRRGQWFTLSMLFSSSAVIQLSGDGKVDLFAVAFGLAACYWAVQTRFTRTRLVLFLTGLFSGFSIVAKLSYAPAMVPMIASLVLWGYASELRSKDQWRSVLSSFLVGSILILVGIVVSFTPHFIKNVMLFHNPIEPIGSGGLGWLKQTWFGPEVTRYILLTYPLALTYGSYWAQYGNMSPLILAFLPLMFYLPRPRFFFSSPLVVVTLSALAGMVMWVIFNPSMVSPRYVLAVLLLFILLPARAAEYASLNDRKPRLLATAIPVFTVIALVSVGLYFVGNIFFPHTMVQYLTEDLNECRRDGDYCSAMNKINRKADAGDRVLLASYHRYWLRADLLQCIQNKKDLAPGGSATEQKWLNLYTNGFRFLLIDKSTHNHVFDSLDLEYLPEWVVLKTIYRTDLLHAYQIEFHQVPSTVQPASCQRLGSATLWEVVYPVNSNGEQRQ